MEVGRDEVTLRTGKQANKRNIQFAHQALLALFGKLGRRRGSVLRRAVFALFVRVRVGWGPLVGGLRFLSGKCGCCMRVRGAVYSTCFASIRADTQEAPKSLSVDSSSSLESLVSTDDEEESVAAPPPPPPPSQPLLPHRTAPLLLGRGAFSSYVRNRGEPDGARASTSEQKGRESDAAFTPSPVDPGAKYARAFRSPHGPPSDTGSPQPSPRLSLTLAHQNKIRSMYTSNSPASDGGGKRPDSSSSTSSMTDWESGQATVRRQPIAKPVITSKAPISATHSRVSDVSAGFMRPHYVSINKSNSQASSGFESQSSDSDFGPRRTGTVRSVYTTVGSASTLKLSKSATMDTLDRLSVRTEVGRPVVGGARGRRDRSTERELSGDSAEGQAAGASAAVVSTGAAESGETRSVQTRKMPEVQLDSSIGKLLRPRTNHAATIHENDSLYNYRSGDEMSMKMGHMGHKSIQDHIIATQMSRLNREMPISDVYHERNLGLGLAPPLSKLLMSAAQPIVAPDHADAETKSASEDSFGNFDKLSLADDNQLALPPKPDFKPKPPPIPPKRFGPKPWVSAHPQVANMGVSLETSSGLPQASVAELSRRDEGDGRSMTDSHYSGYSPSRGAGASKPAELSGPMAPPAQGRGYYELKNSAGVSGAEREQDTLGAGPQRPDEALLHTVADLHTYAAFNPAYEHDEPLAMGSVGARIGSSEIAEYMEQLLGTTEPSENDQSDEASEAKAKTCKRPGKHPVAWSKAKGHKQFSHHTQQSSSC